MKEYIDKSKVVAQIEQRIRDIDEIGTLLSPKGVLTNILCYVKALETKKEVDLEKEINYWKGYKDGLQRKNYWHSDKQ